MSLSRTCLLTRSLSSASSLLASKDANAPSTQKSDDRSKGTQSDSEKKPHAPCKTKTVAQADIELRERLEKMSGDGGASGIEYEDGQPSAMKRGVRNNMFRVI
jgi:hypothetical protein